MNRENYTLQLVRPHELATTIGQWIRATRQRAGWTQPMLASRAGVPASTLSRLERTGNGSIELLARLLFALGEIDSLQAIIQERLQTAQLPTNLSELPKMRKPTFRVRPKKGKAI